MNKYWEEELETMPRKALEKLQLERLKKTFGFAVQSPYYKQLSGKLNLTADSFQHISDIRKIPFTTKEDLRNNYPYGLEIGRASCRERV